MPLSHNFTASPPNLPGHWGPQSSVVNFCEIDYEVTPYIAEFINTLTNLTYIAFAFTTLPRSARALNPLTWPLCNLCLMAVGGGSFLFHACLKHTAQIVDEFGMYAITGSLNYAVYTDQASNDSLNFTSLLSKSLFGGFFVLSTIFVLYGNYITRYNTGADIHTALFVLMLSTFWPRILYLVNHAPPTESIAKAKATHGRRLRTFRNAALSFVVGFGIWVCDGIYCQQLRSIRAAIGLPFAWLFEFHGLWHILTAIGAAMFVKLAAELADDRSPKPITNGVNGVSKKVSWTDANGKEINGNGTANGHAKHTSPSGKQVNGNTNGTAHKKNKGKQ